MQPRNVSFILLKRPAWIWGFVCTIHLIRCAIKLKEFFVKTEIQIAKQALKDLKRTPIYIQVKFRAWLVAVNQVGLEETRKRSGWHDEPLLGLVCT